MVPESLEKRDCLAPLLLSDEGQLSPGFVDDEAAELVVEVDVAEGPDVGQVDGVGQPDLVPDLQDGVAHMLVLGEIKINRIRLGT